MLQLIILLKPKKNQQTHNNIYIHQKMQPNSQQFKNLPQNSKYLLLTLTLKQQLSTPKDTIILFYLQPAMGKIISQVAKWMLGATISMEKKKNYEVIQEEGIQWRQVAVDGDGVGVFESQAARVVVVGFELFGEDDQKVEKKVFDRKVEQCFFNVLAMGNILKYGKQSRIKICGAVKPNQDDEKKQAQMLKFAGFDSLFLVRFKPQNDFNRGNQLRIQQNEDKASKGPSSLSTLFQKLDPKQSITQILDTLLKQPQVMRSGETKNRPEWQKQVIKKIQNYRKDFNSCLQGLIGPTVKISEMVLDGSDGGKQISELFKPEIQYLKKIIGQNPEMKSYVTSIPLENKRILNNKLAYKYFVLKLFRAKMQNQKRKNDNQEDTVLLKDLFSEILKLIELLPLTIEPEDKKYFLGIASLIVQQFEMLKLINSKNFSSSVTQVHKFLRLKKKNSTSQIDQIPFQKIQQTIALQISKLELQPSESPFYYDTFSNLLDECFQNFDLTDVPNGEEIQFAIEQFRVRLPVYKTETLLNSPYESQVSKLEAIENYFRLSFSEKVQYSFNVEFKILKAIGKCLRGLGLPELAIQIFKKLKFENEVQKCIKQIIRKKNLKQTTQGSQQYHKISNYFFQIGNTEKSFKYAQLAYENAPNTTYLKYLIQAKQKLMMINRSITQKQVVDQMLNIIGASENDSQIDYTVYFSNYNYEEEFKESVVRVVEGFKGEKVELRVEVGRGEVRGVGFLSTFCSEDED